MKDKIPEESLSEVLPYLKEMKIISLFKNESEPKQNSKRGQELSEEVNLMNFYIQYQYMTNYLEHIEIVPGKRFSKPILKGSRIFVYDILNWLANGMTKEEIVEDFPELTDEKLKLV